MQVELDEFISVSICLHACLHFTLYMIVFSHSAVDSASGHSKAMHCTAGIENELVNKKYLQGIGNDRERKETR